jgi:hypothetical protein
MSNLTDAELLDALGVEVGADIKSSKSPREERILSGFEDIERFVEQHGLPPSHGESNDIFERIYAVRLDAIRNSEECRTILSGLDKHGLLNGDSVGARHIVANLDDEALLAELGVSDENDITKLTHVKPRAEIRAAEEIARRQPCEDFETFKPLFIRVQEELTSKARRTIEFKDNAQVQQGDFFILGGQKVYVAQVGDEFINDYDRPDRRLRVIYDNGTESDILLRSLQRALQKDEGGRRITDPHAGPLFSDVVEDDDLESGTIYVLRSNLDHPFIKEHRDVIHKIGVTGGDIKRRIANAKMDPTFLMADVEVVATYKLSNINRTKLENLIHRFFEPAKLNVEIKDRFGNLIVPREWFLVPMHILNQAIEKIKEGTLPEFKYLPASGKILKG